MENRFKKSCLNGIVYLILFFPLLWVSCKDTALEHYYTFTGETVKDYLTNREEKFSDFLRILERAKLLDLLSTYGEYTCFAPTNEAVEQYLLSKNILSVDDLTKEVCDTIAKTHLVMGAYYTVDLEDGVLPNVNFLNRYMTLTTDSTITDGEIRIVYKINKTASILVRDDSVENGVVHTLDQVITSNSNMLPEVLSSDSTISIFYEALLATHLNDSLYEYKDLTYSCGLDSVENGIYYHTGNENEYAYYMEERFIKFTAFVEPDSVYHKYNIYNLEDLKAYAKSVYDLTYPEDAGLYDDDLTNRKNPLNRFVAYHLLDRLANYNSLNVPGDIKTYMQVVDLADATDFYETMCPFTCIKSSFPSDGIYLNRVGLKSTYTRRGVRVISPTETSVDQDAVNGVYHYIDDILEYSQDAVETVFNTRFRLDATTLSPDFMTSGARGRAGTDECTGFKVGSVKYWSFTDATFVSVRNRHTNFVCHQGDEIVLLGQFDFEFKLPPVPDGTYEIRVGYCTLPTRGIVQVYFDDKPVGIPLDLRIYGYDPKIGWLEDTGDEEEDRANDKAMHSRGYMKGPDSEQCWWGYPVIFRGKNDMIRCILTTQYFDNSKSHYLRFKQVMDNTKAEFAFDYMELCPKSVYAGAEGEDTH